MPLRNCPDLLRSYSFRCQSLQYQGFHLAGHRFPNTVFGKVPPKSEGRIAPCVGFLCTRLSDTQIARTIGRPYGTSCQLPCRWSKFVDGKSRDNTPPPTIFPETHNRWKG